MLKHYTEYRETQQLRKDHLAQKKQRQAFLIVSILGALLTLVMIVKAVTPAEPVTAATPIVQPVTAATPAEIPVEATAEAEQFAVIVTKPLETLTSDDLDFMTEKAEDPCYASNVQLPREEMIAAIVACSK